MRSEYFLFVHHTISILAKLSTWCFEHSGDMSFLYSLTRATLISPGKNETRVCGYIYITEGCIILMPGTVQSIHALMLIPETD